MTEKDSGRSIDLSVAPMSKDNRAKFEQELNNLADPSQDLTTRSRSFPWSRGVSTAIATLFLMGAPEGAKAVLKTPAPPSSGQSNYELNDWTALTEEEQESFKAEVTKALKGGPTPTPMPEVDPQMILDIISEKENAELQVYRDEAKERGVEDPAWNEFCANILRAYDKSRQISAEDGIPKTKGENKWQTGVVRDNLIEICVNKDTSKVILEENNDPGILSNCDEKYERAEKAFRGMIDWYKENGVPNIVEILTDNGMCIFSPIVSDERGVLFATYDEYGVFYVNMTEAKLAETPDIVLQNILRNFSLAETFAIGYLRVRLALNLGRNEFMEEAVKKSLAGECCSDMFNETGIQGYFDLSKGFLEGAQVEADKVGLPLNFPELQQNIRFLKINGLIKPLSASGWKIEIASK